MITEANVRSLKAYAAALSSRGFLAEAAVYFDKDISESDRTLFRTVEDSFNAIVEAQSRLLVQLEQESFLFSSKSYDAYVFHTDAHCYVYIDSTLHGSALFMSDTINCLCEMYNYICDDDESIEELRAVAVNAITAEMAQATSKQSASEERVDSINTQLHKLIDDFAQDNKDAILDNVVSMSAVFDLITEVRSTLAEN